MASVVAGAETPHATVALVGGERVYTAGDEALLAGLVAAPELNGERVRLEAFDGASGRWAVTLLRSSPRGLRVRAANLVPAPPRRGVLDLLPAVHRVLLPLVGLDGLGRFMAVSRAAARTVAEHAATVRWDERDARVEVGPRLARWAARCCNADSLVVRWPNSSHAARLPSRRMAEILTAVSRLQQLVRLSLSCCCIGSEGARAFAAALAPLAGLQALDLGECDLLDNWKGDGNYLGAGLGMAEDKRAGAVALFAALPRLPRLSELNLAGSGSGLHSLRLPSLPSLTSIEITCGGANSWPGDMTLLSSLSRGCPALARLTWDDDKIDDSPDSEIAAALAEMRGLVSLEVSSLGRPGVSVLGGLPLLESLRLKHLRGGPESAAALAAALPALPRLQVLDLSFWDCTGRSTEVVAGRVRLIDGFASQGALSLAAALHCVPGLRELSLRECELSNGGAVALAKALASVPLLTKLDLGGKEPDDTASLTESPVGFFVALDKQQREMGPSACFVAMSLPALPLLVSLCLRNNPGCTGKLVAEALCRLSQLEDLDVSGNDYSAKDVGLLSAALPSAPGLSRLVLDRNRVGDKGARALATALQGLPRLCDLRLRRAGIGPKGALALSAALPSLTRLEIFDLRNNDVTDEGVAPLGDAVISGACPRLTKLLVSGASLSAPDPDAEMRAGFAALGIAYTIPPSPKTFQAKVPKIVNLVSVVRPRRDGKVVQETGLPDDPYEFGGEGEGGGVF